MYPFHNQYKLPIEINLFVIPIGLGKKKKSNSGRFECQFHGIEVNANHVVLYYNRRIGLTQVSKF